VRSASSLESRAFPLRADAEFGGASSFFFHILLPVCALVFSLEGCRVFLVLPVFTPFELGLSTPYAYLCRWYDFLLLAGNVVFFARLIIGIDGQFSSIRWDLGDSSDEARSGRFFFKIAPMTLPVPR